MSSFILNIPVLASEKQKGNTKDDGGCLFAINFTYFDLCTPADKFLFCIRQENGKFCLAQCALNSVNVIVQLNSFDLKGVLSRNHRKKTLYFGWKLSNRVCCIVSYILCFCLFLFLLTVQSIWSMLSINWTEKQGLTSCVMAAQNDCNNMFTSLFFD